MVSGDWGVYVVERIVSIIVIGWDDDLYVLRREKVCDLV